MLPLSIKDDEYKPTKFNLLGKISGWFRSILSDKTSRNLFFFLCLNLSFAFIELLYGIWSNSLGLISDSFHMFFDCTALLAGLAASVISRWRSNDSFSYGYVRAEVLAGFVNGLFLIFTAFFIFSEGVERALEPPDVHHERLLPVSIAGLLVNLVGIFVFQHGGHGHSHGGDEGTSWSTGMVTATPCSMAVWVMDTAMEVMDTATAPNTGMTTGTATGMTTATGMITGMITGMGATGILMRIHTVTMITYTRLEKAPVGRFWKRRQELLITAPVSAPLGLAKREHFWGVFLHIVADTLGSIGVIISAILMQKYDLMIADPICSMLISILIGVSILCTPAPPLAGPTESKHVLGMFVQPLKLVTLKAKWLLLSQTPDGEDPFLDPLSW
ncbi:hypothetical protein JZ751_024721, partial [Albula glossodonta]